MHTVQFKFLPVVCTLVLVGGLAAETLLLRPRPEEAEPYHARVYKAGEQIPHDIGDWHAPPKDEEVTQEAITLLRPNIIVSRIYTSRSDPRKKIKFLFVHCRSAQDMAGHYPPICYKNQGFHKTAAIPMTWELPGPDQPAGKRTISGVEYEFQIEQRGGTATTVVANLLILPPNRFLRDMDEVYAVSGDYLRRFFGAAQIQIIIPGEVSSEERRQIVTEMLGANLKVLDALGSGGKL